jgi:hypothetical protein
VIARLLGTGGSFPVGVEVVEFAASVVEALTV